MLRPCLARAVYFSYYYWRTQVNVDAGISPVEVATFQSSRSGARPILLPTPPAGIHAETHGHGIDRQQSFKIGEDLTGKLGRAYNPVIQPVAE